jgi:hypothetical protein
MATTGTNNNTPAVVRRVGASSNKNTMTFTSVAQGQLETPDASANKTTDSVISKIDYALGGLRQVSKLGGKRDYTFITTEKDYNLTGTGATKVLDQYGRVLVINGANIEVEKTAAGQPKFSTTATTFSADLAPGTKSYEDNTGLVYFTKMTAGSSVTTLTVGDQLAS